MADLDSNAADHAPGGRLPGPARRSVRTLEQAFTSGSDEGYVAALARLEQVAAGLDARGRELLNSELAAAHARITEREALAVLVAALAGPWETMRQLPGDVELVRLVAGGEQMLATVPVARPDDAPAVVALVEGARAALRAGRCGRCGAGLSIGIEGQAALPHTGRCRLSEAKIVRARARTAR